MPLIAISRDSYTHGNEIAQKVAQRLGLECLSREVILEAAEEFHVPERDIERALHDAPSILERMSSRKERHLAMFRAALFKHLIKGDTVYHGLAGHFFLAEVPHVLRVRVVADIEERVAEEMRREGLDDKTARKRIEREDDERARWTKYLFCQDYRHPEQYDLCLNLGVLSVDDAVEVIAAAAARPTFQDSPGQARRLRDLAVAAEAEARLLGRFRRVRASSIEGKVRVEVQGDVSTEHEVAEKVREHICGLSGAVSVCVGVDDEMTRQ